jgi:hypothetical protein
MKYSMRVRLDQIIVTLFLGVLLSPAAQARSTELVEPGTATINCSLPAEKMQQAIITGGAARQWEVVSQNPGNTVLKYVKGDNKHVLVVTVSYTATTFEVTYKDSSNLNYTIKADGTRRIHPRPVGWMKNLSMDIQRTANNLCVQ